MFLSVGEKQPVVRQAEIRLCLHLSREGLVVLPKVDDGVRHFREIHVDPLADVAGLLQLADALQRLLAGARRKSAAPDLFFEFV